MDPVEMKRFRKLFVDSTVETAKAIMEMNETEFSESPVELNRAAALKILESILTGTDHVLAMIDIEGLDAYYAEIQINLFTNKVLLLSRLVQIAMPNAGTTLHCVLCCSMKLIRDIVMRIIRNIVGVVAHGLGSSQFYRDLLVDDIARLRGEMQFSKTSIQFANDTLIAERLSFIKENLIVNADILHAKGGIFPLMAGRISYDAATLIEELLTCNFLSTDVRFVTSMEELLRKSIHISQQIRWLHQNLSSLEQIPEMVKILDDIRGCKFTDSVDSKLYPNHLSDREDILNCSIQGFKSVLNYRSRYV